LLRIVRPFLRKLHRFIVAPANLRHPEAVIACRPAKINVLRSANGRIRLRGLPFRKARRSHPRRREECCSDPQRRGSSALGQAPHCLLSRPRVVQIDTRRTQNSVAGVPIIVADWDFSISRAHRDHAWDMAYCVTMHIASMRIPLLAWMFHCSHG
jgi:hypothetical protein